MNLSQLVDKILGRNQQTAQPTPHDTDAGAREMRRDDMSTKVEEGDRERDESNGPDDHIR